VTERAGSLSIFGVDGMPETLPGDDLVGQIANALRSSGEALVADDVVVVTHKIISKVEGRLVDLRQVEPSPFAMHLASIAGKDARQIEVVLRESVRIVKMDHGVIICETRQGFVCANAGVDASNVGEPDVVCLQPVDPNASAERLRQGLVDRFGVEVGVVVTDTFGRAWRNGVVNVAIGVAGLAPLDDYRGQLDPNAYELRATVLAVADELAAAAELVMGKLARRPVAIVRGFGPLGQPGSGRELVMDPARDMFR
jgi:coenzyme F420-0:L-glutamate ligase/coenzyme F420-1:gamma-L-glutamate ligase